jgi:hypothetical protein
VGVGVGVGVDFSGSERSNEDISITCSDDSGGDYCMKSLL